MSGSGLLRLPREIRDEIYQYLLAYTSEAPVNTSFAGPRLRIKDIMYPRSLGAVTSAINLALTNHQLYAEMQPAISPPPPPSPSSLTSRLSPPETADLDIMVKGFMYYPTWTYLPRLTRSKPFNLNVRLRIFSTESFLSNDGWPRQPGSGFRSLMHLLNMLVENGPAFYYTPSVHSANSHRPFVLDCLSIVVEFHDLYTPATHPQTAKNVFGMLKVLARDGIAGGAVRVIRAKADYIGEDGERSIFEREWKVSEQLDSAKARDWGAAGFFFAALVV